MNPVIQYINSTKINTNVNQKKKKHIPERIKQNMETNGTTETEAYLYETHCHNCGLTIPIGKRYCDDSCSKMIEINKFECYWKKSCKMCNIYNQYCVLNSNFEFTDIIYFQ